MKSLTCTIYNLNKNLRNKILINYLNGTQYPSRIPHKHLSSYIKNTSIARCIILNYVFVDIIACEAEP